VGMTSPTQQVTIKNVSTSPVLMNVLGGAAGVFGGSTNCQGMTLNPGASCSMSYAFTPSVVGPVTASTSGSVNGQSFSFTFKGNGVAKFFISPTGFDFGDVVVGTTSPTQQVTIKNVSTSPVLMNVLGGAAGVFGGSTYCQGMTLNPGASCYMSYAFTPSVVGPVTMSTSGSVNGQNFSFTFKGNGIGG
jgi:hypothetical protein